MGDSVSIQGGVQRPGSRFSEQEKLRLQRAVRDFEALFVGYMLKSMKSTIPEGGMGGGGLGGDMLGSIADMEFAKQISRSRSFGLGEMLYRQITGETLPANPARPAAAPESTPAKPAEGSTDPSPMIAPSSAPQGRAPSTLFPSSEKTGIPPSAVAERVNTYAPYIAEAAEKHGIDRGLIKAVIAAESAGRAKARSARNAKGLMQLIDTTAADMGARDVWNPRENILAGARYLRQMLDRFGGDVGRALASYNAGPGAVERHGGIPPFRETREYVQRVMTYLTMFAQEANDGND